MTDTLDIPEEELATRAAQVERLISLVELAVKQRKVVPESATILSAREFKKKMVAHAARLTTATLESAGRLENEYFIRKSDNPDQSFPDSVFSLVKIDGKCVAGTRFDFLVDDGLVSVENEDFTGVALEVILDDLEDEGYEC